MLDCDKDGMLKMMFILMTMMIIKMMLILMVMMVVKTGKRIAKVRICAIRIMMRR